MKLILNLEILVGLGRFLPLGGDVLQNHFVRHIAAARCKVFSGPQMPPPKLPTQMRELHQQLVTGLPPASPYSPTDTAAPTQTNGHDPCQHVPSLSQYLSPYRSRAPVRAPRPNRPTQHRPAIFGNPNQVILEIVFRVTRRPIYLHMDLLPQGFA